MPGVRRRAAKRRRSSECEIDECGGWSNANDPEVSFNVDYHQHPPRKRLKLDLSQPEIVSERVEKSVQECVLSRKSPNGFILPDPLPSGLVIEDLRGVRWKVGSSVGIGGFGEIYSTKSLSPKVTEDFVIKVEPYSNGPLFVEVNFYLKCAKKEWIDEYKEKQGLKHLGVPYVRGSGSFWFREKKFRFLVIPRYGTDLQTLLDQSGSSLSVETACRAASQVIDSYKYIHSKGYVHKDVKGSNLLFDYSTASDVGSTGMRLHLVDFGLASKYTTVGIHKPYVRDDRAAHEGTLEYSSRDAHLGCISRRGDIEVLFYNLIDWIGGKLPWDEPHFVKPKVIQDLKIQAFRDSRQFLNESFGDQPYPEFLYNLMEYIGGIEFEEEPDYDYVKDLLDRCHSKSVASSPMSIDNSASVSSDDASSSDEVVLSIEMKPKAKTRSTKLVCDGSDGRQRKCRKLEFKRLPRRKPGDNLHQLDVDEGLEEEIFDRNELLRQKSANRFNREWESVLSVKGRKSLENPTPNMMQRLNRISSREGRKSMEVSSPRSGKRGRRRRQSGTPQRSRNGENGSSKTSLQQTSGVLVNRLPLHANSSKENTTETRGNKSRSPEKPNIRTKLNMLDCKDHVDATADDVNGLRRSFRMHSAVYVGQERSFRENISELFSIVTRSILRLPQN